MWMWLSLLAAVGGSSVNLRAGENMQVPPARDGNIAIMEELDAARASRRVADYELFIARHPDHPLAQVARAELNALRAKRP